MEPVTHLLTGACLSRASGFPARARYATAACVIAAELPDADYVYRLGGPLTYFQHHRGWTHAFWSLPLQAVLVVAFFWVLHRTRPYWKKHRSVDEPAPVRWGLLWLMALAALCSHILLDWTNNYGVRPLAPFYPKWFAGEMFYIIEPTLLIALALALLLPLVFSLVQSEIGIRRTRYQGRWLALAPLVLMLFMMVQRSMAHADADALAHAQQVRGGVVQSSESPYPLGSNKWHVVLETPQSFEVGLLNLEDATFDSDPQQKYQKLADTPTVTAAKRSWLGQVYLDWSKFPQVVDAGTAAQVHPEMSLPADAATLHVVRFFDLRFKYDALFLHGASGPTPLGAEAWIDDQMQVRRVYVGSALQKLP